jgi:hypothetical protein
VKKRFMDRRTRRLVRHARILQKRWKGSHLMWTALGSFAVQHDRHWGTSAWDGIAGSGWTQALAYISRPGRAA